MQQVKLLPLLSSRFAALSSFRAQAVLVFGGLLLGLTAALALVVHQFIARQAVRDQGQQLRAPTRGSPGEATVCSYQGRHRGSNRVL